MFLGQIQLVQQGGVGDPLFEVIQQCRQDGLVETIEEVARAVQLGKDQREDQDSGSFHSVPGTVQLYISFVCGIGGLVFPGSVFVCSSIVIKKGPNCHECLQITPGNGVEIVRTDG